MKKQLFSALLVLGSAIAPCALYGAEGSPQSMQVDSSLKIPDATLKSGTYTFQVEDRLSDRAIVRVTGDNGKHYLLLAVPSRNSLTPDKDGFVYFSENGKGDKALRGWKCSSCYSALEFVYPKLEAVSITDASTQPVLAVDPSYDKLPAKLAPDDMKVVTLWLLAPETITANNEGKGVKAQKFAEAPHGTETAQNAAPASDASATPAPVHTHKHTQLTAENKLPKTASNTYTLLLSGCLLMSGALALRLRRAIASRS